MQRVDFMVGARDFKGIKAEQFMPDAVYCYAVNTTCEQVTPEMTAGGFGSVPLVNEEGKWWASSRNSTCLKRSWKNNRYRH